ncbi:Insulin-degrading enzyme [Eumeta japonica]|uniref:Insulin-degrading enzyme n=1 Tax=Eumeta variegata TaxID=151549 RepID=A0A4C1T966_EUMVA|nr:Insulin-degrading enzyme [Eumeta japonica]
MSAMLGIDWRVATRVNTLFGEPGPPGCSPCCLPGCVSFLREVENGVYKSSCAALYYQCGLRDSLANVVLHLLAQVISEPCFNVLRTKVGAPLASRPPTGEWRSCIGFRVKRKVKIFSDEKYSATRPEDRVIWDIYLLNTLPKDDLMEQLGYSVASGLRLGYSAQGVCVTVQGDRHPQHLERRVEAFLASMKEYIEKMPEEEFVKHRSALAAKRLERPKQLAAKAMRAWREITSQMYNFDRARVEVEYLDGVSRQQLLDMHQKHISAESPTRQKLSVHVLSTAEGGAGCAATEKNGIATPSLEDRDEDHGSGGVQDAQPAVPAPRASHRRPAQGRPLQALGRRLCAGGGRRRTNGARLWDDKCVASVECVPVGGLGRPPARHDIVKGQTSHERVDLIAVHIFTRSKRSHQYVADLLGRIGYLMEGKNGPIEGKVEPWMRE